MWVFGRILWRNSYEFIRQTINLLNTKCPTNYFAKIIRVSKWVCVSKCECVSGFLYHSLLPGGRVFGWVSAGNYRGSASARSWIRFFGIGIHFVILVGWVSNSAVDGCWKLPRVEHDPEKLKSIRNIASTDWHTRAHPNKCHGSNESTFAVAEHRSSILKSNWAWYNAPTTRSTIPKWNLAGITVWASLRQSSRVRLSSPSSTDNIESETERWPTMGNDAIL